MEGLRKLGDPVDFATKYYKDNIDEIILTDVVASLYNRNNLSNIISKITDNIFIPITVAGGIRTLSDVNEMLQSGADKIAINTAIVKNPNFISDVAKTFGAQCMTVSIEAKTISNNKWEVYLDSGREKTGLDAIEWIKQAQDLGAGEIFLSSIDHDGTMNGFNLSLVEAVSKITKVPLIISSGCGNLQHVEQLLSICNPSAIAIGRAFHSGNLTIHAVKELCKRKGFSIR